MTSIDDVAKKAHVSVTTVSRALNNHPYVSDKTKKKIQRAMKELNYYPNNVAQQLRGQKTNLIGVIISYITSPFFAYLVDAIEKAALQRNYHIVVLQTQGDPTLEEFYVDLALKKQFDGLVITNLESPSENVLQLISQGKAVLCNRYIGDTPLEATRIDEFQASYAGTRLLLEHGYRRIAFCTGNIRNPHDERFKGFLQALDEKGVPFDDRLFFAQTMGVSAGRQLVHNFLSNSEFAPRAVFTNGDELAAGIISEANAVGLRIPEQLAVLGFDDQPVANLTNPTITTIQQPITEMGRISTNSLIDSLEEGTPITSHTLSTKIILRESI